MVEFAIRWWFCSNVFPPIYRMQSCFLVTISNFQFFQQTENRLFRLFSVQSFGLKKFPHVCWRSFSDSTALMFETCRKLFRKNNFLRKIGKENFLKKNKHQLFALILLERRGNYLPQKQLKCELDRKKKINLCKLFNYQNTNSFLLNHFRAFAIFQFNYNLNDLFYIGFGHLSFAVSKKETKFHSLAEMPVIALQTMLNYFSPNGENGKCVEKKWVWEEKEKGMEEVEFKVVGSFKFSNFLKCEVTPSQRQKRLILVQDY